MDTITYEDCSDKDLAHISRALVDTLEQMSVTDVLPLRAAQPGLWNEMHARALQIHTVHTELGLAPGICARFIEFAREMLADEMCTQTQLETDLCCELGYLMPDDIDTRRLTLVVARSLGFRPRR
ncbi:hypothetical protein [Amycolatopsis sp. NPDC058986]|uniref:hypothetical protein n=1 Tax=unclassified Amycolatopsis TaxID=2618356 RepID=UPI00366EAA9A